MLLLTFLTTFVLTSANNELIQKMKTAGIIPDVIDEIEAARLNINYPNGKQVDFGGELTPTDVKDEPKVHFNADPSKYYSLVMVDPDAPSREDPKFREVNHWLVVNICGSDLSTGEAIAEYFGSGPPKGTGLHRYIFLVFEQPGKLEVDEPRTSKTSRQHRFNFNVRSFAKKYNLGKPIAGNYFHAQWDPYVEERKKFITS